MIQAIRIEHLDGYGIFVGTDSTNQERLHSIYNLNYNLCSKHSKMQNPKEDGIKMHLNLFCAYHSIIQMFKYIKPEDFELLFDNGYNVYLLELSKAQIGKDNVVFNKKHIINKTNISKLFKE